MACQDTGTLNTILNDLKNGQGQISTPRKQSRAIHGLRHKILRVASGKARLLGDTNMRSRRPLAAIAAWTVLAITFGARVSPADEVNYEVKDGIRYQVTRQVVQRPIAETRYESR